MKNKFLLIFFCLFLMFSSLAFAGGARDDGMVELTFMETFTSPSRTKLIMGFIAEFEAMNPGVKINLISPPYEQADNRITLALSSKEKLDIVEVRDYTVKQFANNGYLMNLEDFLKEWDGTDTLLPIALNSARTVDNTAYLIPEFFFIKALFVRTDVLKDLGITEYPKTIDELIDMSIAITDRKKGQYGFSIRGKHGEFKHTDYMTISNLDNLDPDNIYLTRDGKFSFAEDVAREYLERYVELYKKAVPEDGINWGFNEQVNAFVSGTAPFLLQDPDTVGLLDGQLSRDQYTVIPLPPGRAGIAYLDYGFGGLGITSYSENKKEAMDFLAFMLSADVNSRFNRSYGPLPVHSSIYEEDDYFSSGVYKAWHEMMDNNPDYVFVRYPVDSDKWSGWSELHTLTQQSLFLGKMTVDEVIDEWTKYWSD